MIHQRRSDGEEEVTDFTIVDHQQKLTYAIAQAYSKISNFNQYLKMSTQDINTTETPGEK